MLASLLDSGWGDPFLGLIRPEQLGAEPKSSVDILLNDGFLGTRNPVEGALGNAAEGPTSSGSGHTHAARHEAEYPNAQKKFRARQKERMLDLQRQVAEKRAAFEQLSQENLQLRARTSILDKVVNCRDEHLSMVMPSKDSSPSSSQSCFGSGGMSTILNATAADQESFRKMKKEQVIPRYKAFVNEVSDYLRHCQYPCSDPNSPVVQQVTACVENMAKTFKQVLLLNSQLMRQLLMLNLETMQPATATEAVWDGVVASLQLGPEQRQDILAVLELYDGLMAKVYFERKAIHEAMGAGVGTLNPDACTFMERNNLALEMELLDRLNSNLSKEHSAHTLLSCFFFGKVLTPVQFAKVAIFSYPFFPDCLAVATAVARQDGLIRRGPGAGSGPGAGLPHRLGSSAASGSAGGSHDSHRQRPF